MRDMELTKTKKKHAIGVKEKKTETGGEKITRAGGGNHKKEFVVH